MYPKKYTGFAGRFIVACFLLFSCIYNAGYFLMDASINTIPQTERDCATGDNKPDTEEETCVVQVSSQQQLCHSRVRIKQRQEHLLMASVYGSCQAMQSRMAAFLAGPGFLEKPYYYILLFRHNLF
jgi:hypothetical protein